MIQGFFFMVFGNYYFSQPLDGVTCVDVEEHWCCMILGWWCTLKEGELVVYSFGFVGNSS